MIKTYEIEEIGLNKNESFVFVSLIKLGEATAGDLIKKTGFHRNIVYDNLEKLLDKGLVIYIIKNGIRYYKLSSPEAIIELMKIKRGEFEKKEKLAKKLSLEIKREIYQSKLKSTAQLYQGKLGIREIMNDTLKVDKDYIVYGAPKSSVELMGETFWKNYTLKRKEKTLIVKMLFNEELRNFGNSLINNYTKIKYLPKQFDSLTETTVYGNKVAIMVWTEKPITVLIEDDNVAKAYKKYFEVLWKIARL